MNYLEAITALNIEHARGRTFFLKRKKWEKKYIYLINLCNSAHIFTTYENPTKKDSDDYFYTMIEDALANDWEMVKTESIETLHDFQETLKALKEGKSIRRKGWGSYIDSYIDNPDKIFFRLRDIEAKDWIIEK